MATAKKDYKIEKKRSGRYAVRANKGNYINGEEKVAILSKEGLIKAPAPKPKEEPAAAEETASE